MLRGGPGRKGGTDCSLFILGFLLPFLFGNHTVALKDTSQRTQGECRAERRRQVAPVFHPGVIMPSILLTRQEHPPWKGPRDKPLTISRRQQTMACLGLEVLKSQPKSERSDRLK